MSRPIVVKPGTKPKLSKIDAGSTKGLTKAQAAGLRTRPVQDIGDYAFGASGQRPYQSNGVGLRLTTTFLVCV